MSNIFTGIDADVAVRNTNATMHRVSYHITIIGKITFLLPAEPEGQTRWVLAIALLTSRHRVEAVSRPSSALVSVAGRSALVPSARSSARRTFRSRCDLIRQGSREPPQFRASDNWRPNSQVPLALALRHRRQRHQMQEGR